MSNRARLALPWAGGAAALAGIVAVGVAVIPRPMLRTNEAPKAFSPISPTAIARDSGLTATISPDGSHSNSKDTTAEIDAYAAYFSCANSPPTPNPSASPQVTVVDLSAPKASPQSESHPSQPKD
jgi:hypothetical protein